jgi:hypothetical protein
VVGWSALPHPNPLPLGEGTATNARRGTKRVISSPALASFLPLPAGEGRGEGESWSCPQRPNFAAVLLSLFLTAFSVHADSLTTLDGKSVAGKISVEPGAFVLTAADASVQRVPLAEVRAVKFDRAAFSSRPVTWQAHGVGAVPVEGGFSQSNGVFLVASAGTSAHVDDGHFFVRQPVGESARLTAFVPPQHYVRLTQDKFKAAGLALHARADGGGAACWLYSEGGKSGVTRWRTAEGKERSKHFTMPPEGGWLRLERCAQQVTALVSDDGATWRQVGNELLALGDEAHLGMLALGQKKGHPVTVGFSRVELLHEDAPPAPLPQLRLRDGGVLAGRFLGTDGSVVRWHALGRDWNVSLVNASRLLLDPRAEAQFHRLRPERPGALLASGDFVDGELIAGEPGRVTISSVLFGIRSYSAEGAVLAVHLRDAAEAGAEFEIQCADGSRLLASQLEVRAGGLAGRERSAGEFLLRTADLLELRRASAR